MKPVIISYRKEHTIRERILLWLLGVVIPLHALFYYKRKPWGLMREDLVQYPAGSLGRELGLFLVREGLQPIRRIERHDAFHILFDFTTSVSDEAAMQFFLVGNGKISPFTLSTAVFAGLMLPEKWSIFYAQFRRGRAAMSISRWDFSALLDEQLEEIKQAIFNGPAENPVLKHKLEKFENKAG